MSKNYFSLRTLKALFTLKINYLKDAILVFPYRVLRPSLAYDNIFVTANTIENAFLKGLEYLQRQQFQDGSLKGFLLYPGASTSWISSHVAFVLENCTPANNLCLRIAKYLTMSGADDGGWGYNRFVSIDNDSTAQALMVLDNCKINYHYFILENLVKRQHNNGGFTTYAYESNTTNAWQIPHPDVTLVVLELLKRQGGFKKEVERGERWLMTMRSNGVVKNYWWGNNSYSIWAQAKCNYLYELDKDNFAEFVNTFTSIPELAMITRMGVLIGMGYDVALDIVNILLSSQLRDGSWPCSPILRVTSQKSYFNSEDHLTGKLFSDYYRSFSTAHCINALDILKKYLSSF
ncbi:MAG TPA: hypothetical protein VFN30_10540 [Chitinophagaceae bacterium]|nr:hypothetical protein [Chitinophagaceae bacterium]